MQQPMTGIVHLRISGLGCIKKAIALCSLQISLGSGTSYVPILTEQNLHYTYNGRVLIKNSVCSQLCIQMQSGTVSYCDDSI